MFRDLLEDSVGLALVAFLLLTLAGTGGAIWWAVGAAAEEHARWVEFSEKHECRVTERASGSMQVGSGWAVGANGKAGVVTTVTQSPDRTAYLCNDGVVYWR